MFRQLILITTLWAFVFSFFPKLQANEIILPKPGEIVQLTPAINPPILKGIKVNLANPFKFEFIMDKGKTPTQAPTRGHDPDILVESRDRVPASPAGGPESVAKGSSVEDENASEERTKLPSDNPDALKQEINKLIKYFLAALTVPEKDFWVNLSPYEKNRIVPDAFGQTEMGRDLLAQDYMLKQITASLMHPDSQVGKDFWKKVYQEAMKMGQERSRSLLTSVNLFNKVWIVPEKAVVYENAKAGTAYVVESRLKVMLERDYLALDKNMRAGDAKEGRTCQANERACLPAGRHQRDTAAAGPAHAASQIIREIVIPELTKEINEGKNFAQLRQIYNSLILATWYKKKIKDSILNQVYSNKNKIKGTEYSSSVIANASLSFPKAVTLHVSSPNVLVGDLVHRNDLDARQKLSGLPSGQAGMTSKDDVELIYQQYLQSLKKGVYNLIKEEQDPVTGWLIPRKFFSGGAEFINIPLEDNAMAAQVKDMEGQSITVTFSPLIENKPIHKIIGGKDAIELIINNWFKAKNKARKFPRETWLRNLKDAARPILFYIGEENVPEAMYLVSLEDKKQLKNVLKDDLKNEHNGEDLEKFNWQEVEKEIDSIDAQKIFWGVIVESDGRGQGFGVALKQEFFKTYGNQYYLVSMEGYIGRNGTEGQKKWVKRFIDDGYKQIEGSIFYIRPPQELTTNQAMLSLQSLQNKADLIVNPNNFKAEIYDDPDDVSRRGAIENADIIEVNNKLGVRSVIGLFTGTRGKAFSKAFVEEIIRRNLDLSRTKFFYLDEYYMGRDWHGRWHDDERSYHYFSVENFIKLLNKDGKERIKADQVLVLNGEADDIQVEIKRWDTLLAGALKEKVDSGGEPKLDIMNMGSGSHGHLAFIEATVRITQEMLENITKPNNLLAIRNNNKFLLLSEMLKSGKIEDIIGSILAERKRHRELPQYKEDLERELRAKILANGKEIPYDFSDKVSRLGEILKSQPATIFIDGLTNEEKSVLNRISSVVNIQDAQSIYTVLTVGEELAFSTIVDNYSDFPNEIDQMTGRALTTAIGTMLTLSLRARVYAFGNKTTTVMGEVSRILKPSAHLPISALLNHSDAKFILDTVAAKEITNSAMITPEIRATKTILIVDDSSDHRQINMSALKEVGYKVLLANNGVEGLQMLKENKIDGVVLDEEMGGDGVINSEMRRIWKERSGYDGYLSGQKGWDGSEMLQAMRADPSFKNIPVIFRTSTADAYESNPSFFPDPVFLMSTIGAQAIFGKDIPSSEIIKKMDFLIFKDHYAEIFDGIALELKSKVDGNVEWEQIKKSVDYEILDKFILAMNNANNPIIDNLRIDPFYNSLLLAVRYQRNAIWQEWLKKIPLRSRSILIAQDLFEQNRKHVKMPKLIDIPEEIQIRGGIILN